ncbi:MAG: tRNA (N(6)-L-threonylcarbamoyladenosine(37)-C(2))-methylthiotransferase MtaB [Candidatus Delongbacteria bacterium]|nr:tRNA (N(6)-L-threonylcarbamoyladenosine(37)-C(2))-methylthiotransferase MtaB [Candidatus Delongbacteria bacterium]
MPRVASYSFGCKLNHYETAVMISRFVEAGWVVVDLDQQPDLVIIDTCTVTERADFKVRQKIRRVQREHPEARLLVSGCLAQRDPGAISGMAGVDLVLGNREKLDPLAYLEQTGRVDLPTVHVGEIPTQQREQLTTSLPPHFHRQTRGFIKVQDGCDTFCSFCIVPHVRGRSRSLSPAAVVTQAQELAHRGYRELVLTGVHIGAYGRDLAAAVDLADLLEQLGEIEELPRLRISSIEPWDITVRLLETMAQLPAVMPHLHTAIQSASDSVLKRMRRRSTSIQLQELMMRLDELLPDAGIGTDILTGFPGETEEEFEQTYSFLRQHGISYLHVFPYSIREGTPAALMEGQHPRQEKNRRVKRLLQLDEILREEFSDRYLQTEQQVLVESKLFSGCLTGRTPHYLPVKIPADEVRPNQIVTVRLTERQDQYLLGTPLTTEQLQTTKTGPGDQLTKSTRGV